VCLCSALAQERKLTCHRLGFHQYVDEVIIGSPYFISEDMISSLNISVVVHGDDPIELMADERDPYCIPKERGLYTEVPHTEGINTETVLKRIITRRLQYVSISCLSFLSCSLAELIALAAFRFESSNAKKKEKNSKISPAPVPTEVLANY